MFISLLVSDLCLQQKEEVILRRFKETYKNNNLYNHTFLVIFSLSQKIWLHRFLELKGIRIVAMPPLAINKVGGHGDDPRNQLVVFEFIDPDEKVVAVEENAAAV
jgi:hypothetical protein